MDGPMQRRGFLAVLGASATGLWLAPSRLLAAPRELVLRMSGSCSFCGKTAEQAQGMAGIVGRPARVCGECIGLCLSILQEETGVSRPPAPPPKQSWAEIEARLAEAADKFGLDEAALRAELEADLERQMAFRPREMDCSFCDASHEAVAKMIAGPRDYICDGCIAGAASLLGTCRTHALR